MTAASRPVPLKHFIARVESGTSVNAADTASSTDELGVLKTSCVSLGYFDPRQNKSVNTEEYDRLSCPVIADRLIVSRMNTPSLVGAAGYTKLSHPNLYLPDRLWQIETKNSDTKFIYWWMQSIEYKDQVRLICVGTSSSMQNLSQSDLGSFIIDAPSRERQKQIACYLDRETTKIDALIAKQERLIELLAEKRRAIITQAVTKGLAPSAPVMPSGIPWLGDIPAHWSLHRVSWLFNTISSGTTPPSESADYYGGETNWVTTGELREKPITGTSKKVTQKALSDFSALRVYPPGTILMAMYGATIGRLGVLAAPATVNQACCALASPRGIVGKFAFYALLAAKEHLIVIASGGGQPNINQDKVRSLRLAVPPVEEQARIVEMLDRDLNKLDTLVRHAQRAIELLKERRSALISAAVTGKIDVREGAA